MNLWLSKKWVTLRTYLWLAKEFVIENSVAFLFIGLVGVAGFVLILWRIREWIADQLYF